MGPGVFFSGLSTFKSKASLPGQIRDHIQRQAYTNARNGFG